MNRRIFIQNALITNGGLIAVPSFAKDLLERGIPVSRLTNTNAHHWFGYYDKLQFDPTSRYVLGMSVPFEHRSPTADDVIQVGMVDLEDNDRWIEFGQSNAWNWQQGCMLQWIPGTKSQVLWNDRVGDRFVRGRPRNSCADPVALTGSPRQIDDVPAAALSRAQPLEFEADRFHSILERFVWRLGPDRK